MTVFCYVIHVNMFCVKLTQEFSVRLGKSKRATEQQIGNVNYDTAVKQCSKYAM